MERDRVRAGVRLRGRARIHLTAVDAELREAARELAPLPSQEPFAGDGRSNLRKAYADPSITACVGLADGEPVAFFMLQTRMPELGEHLPDDDVIGMRGFFVDRRRQRLGHGRALLLALPAFVRSLHPDARAVGLTVNMRNEPALRAYLGARFRDTGELYLGGALGPQHVLRLDL